MQKYHIRQCFIQFTGHTDGKPKMNLQQKPLCQRITALAQTQNYVVQTPFMSQGDTDRRCPAEQSKSFVQAHGHSTAPSHNRWPSNHGFGLETVLVTLTSQARSVGQDVESPRRFSCQLLQVPGHLISWNCQHLYPALIL